MTPSKLPEGAEIDPESRHVVYTASGVAAAIAAAEERGRRRGVEEAAKFVEQFDGCMHGECFSEGIRALAPRDSGHEVGVLTDDNATRITAPRDSGKADYPCSSPGNMGIDMPEDRK